MAPRLNKRQLREQEELAALQALETPDTVSRADESEGDENVPVAATGFAALINLGGGGSEEDEEDAPRSTATKKKKKKKKNATSSPAVANSPRTSTPDPGARSPPESGRQTPASAKLSTSKKKQITTKKKGKSQKTDNYDIDKALAELSLQYPTLQKPSESFKSTQASTEFFSLLSVSAQYLDSEGEMRKFFGSKVIAASKAEESSSSSTHGRNQRVGARSILTRPQSAWWPASLRQGLSIRLLTEEEVGQMKGRHGFGEGISGEKVWTVEFSNKYRGASKTFIQMVMSGDPEGFYQIMKVFPYHADTILQLSEVYYHQEEQSTAADFIDRALFTYERAFSGAFSLTSGTNRLDFDRVENRPFFLAVHRKITDLQKQGCVRTAFEFAKLLYSLDPWTDPHGVLLHLDFLSIETGASQWLLDVWDVQGKMSDEQLAGRFNVHVLPGWAYSRALALFITEESKIEKNHDASTTALKEAVLAFPSVVPLLADKIDANITGEIRGHRACRIQTDSISLASESDAVLHILSHLYAQRSSALWKPKTRLAWFTQTVNSLVPLPQIVAGPSTQSFHSLFSSIDRRYSVYRHILVNENTCRRLFSFIPTVVINAKQLACDPLPPPSKVSEYSPEFFQGTEDPFSFRRRGRRETERLLERLVPDPVFRRQLQAFFEAHPQLAERFPGGIIQFAEMAGQLPEEALEDMMIAEVGFGPGDGQGQGEMNMPGMFGMEDDPGVGFANAGLVPHVERFPNGREDDFVDEEDETEEDEEDMEPVQPLPVRFLRNVFNRFWGGGGAQVDAEESSDDDQERGHLPPINPDDVD